MITGGAPDMADLSEVGMFTAPWLSIFIVPAPYLGLH